MSIDPIHLTLQQTPQGAVLAVAGELDIDTAPALERAIREAEAQAGEQLVIDLSELEFMDSSGLHVLLAAGRRARERGPRLTLRRGPRAVQQVFELTDTLSLFHFEP